MFKKIFDNSNLNYGSRGILGEALGVLMNLIRIKTAAEIRDSHGIIGYDIGRAYLVAKKSPYGDVVSVSKQIWDLAIKNKKRILIYIQTSKYIYRFEPKKIKEHHSNFRGDVEMINFDIRAGVNLLKLIEEKRKINKAVKKNIDYKQRELDKIKELSLGGVFD